MKKNLLGLSALVLIVVFSAFSDKTFLSVKPKPASPTDGYFQFVGADNQQSVEAEYTYIGQMPPSGDCTDNDVICTILAPLDDNGHPEDDSYWRPDFSVLGDPVINESSYSYLTKRNSQP